MHDMKYIEHAIKKQKNKKIKKGTKLNIRTTIEEVFNFDTQINIWGFELVLYGKQLTAVSIVLFCYI